MTQVYSTYWFGLSCVIVHPALYGLGVGCVCIHWPTEAVL